MTVTITITMEPADEFVDPDDDSGLTEEGFNGVMDALSEYGWDVRIRQNK